MGYIYKLNQSYGCIAWGTTPCWVVIPSVLLLYLVVGYMYRYWVGFAHPVPLSLSVACCTCPVKIYKNWIILFLGCCDTIDSLLLGTVEE